MNVKLFLEVPIMVDRSLPMPSAEDIRLPELVKAISDQGRLRIVMALADGDFHSTDDLPGLDVQKSTVSHHLRTLREAGFTETQFTGRNCAIRLRTSELDSRFPGFVEALTSPAAIADLNTPEPSPVLVE
jgi:DNA-binding transcriptional ArsR family regulator